MAKRRTREQIEADQIIKKRLNELGEIVYDEARETSRFKTGQLVNSVNYMVKPDTVLTMAQVFYGKLIYPKNVDEGGDAAKNALLQSINKHVPDFVTIIVTDLNDAILKPFKTKQ